MQGRGTTEGGIGGWIRGEEGRSEGKAREQGWGHRRDREELQIRGWGKGPEVRRGMCRGVGGS